MVQQEDGGKGISKAVVKEAIKIALSEGMLGHEDHTKGYWWGMQILMECVIELVASGFKEKEQQADVFKKLFDSVIELIEQGRIYG